MKPRGGDHQRGSSSSLRVVLGATLALAGDTARRELTPPEGPAPDPPREAKKTRRPEKLPEPRFAAAVPQEAKAKPGRKANPKRQGEQQVALARAEAAPLAPRLAEPAPQPESAGVLSAEFRRAIAPEPELAPTQPAAPAPVAETTAPPPEPLPVAAGPLPAPTFGPPTAAAPAPPVAEPAAAPAVAELAVPIPEPVLAKATDAQPAPATSPVLVEAAPAPVPQAPRPAVAAAPAPAASAASPPAKPAAPEQAEPPAPVKLV